jgi:hypothetical protein
MAAAADDATASLIDWFRPTERDGSLIGAVFSTYGLSLSQPDFFGQDFLPTLIGLGGVRDRGYASPVTLDRALAAADVLLISDAHALTDGVRPTLRVDVLPIGHRLQHAKVFLVHRHNRVRLIIASANLTHEGFRRQREAAVVLDFYEGGELAPTVLAEALARWQEVLGDIVDEQLRRILADAVHCTEKWRAKPSRKDELDLHVVFGGGPNPLWRQIVNAWPEREPILNWHICSPFWPQVDTSAANTPFEAIAKALQAKGCSFANCELEIIACAETASPNALPRFPFSIVEYLRTNGFPITRGRILPARLDAAQEEIPQGMAAENRDLHAKWIVLAGRETALAFVGSANFTRQGLGVLRDPSKANIEAGVILKWARGSWHPKQWHPPILGHVIDWATCAPAELRDPPTEEEEIPDWPDFVQKIEMEIHWDRLPDPDGALHVYLRAGSRADFTLSSNPDAHQAFPQPSPAEADGGHVRVVISPEDLRSILIRRAVEVRWSNREHRCWFPVNVLHASKVGMPSILGAKPSEDQLLAYFHGRISEEDVLARLEQEAKDESSQAASIRVEDAERLKRLQSYVVRDFVESLYGLGHTLREACHSRRSAEQAFLGDLSPVCLGERIVHAFMAGKRSPTAACFQLVELLRVVSEVKWLPSVQSSEETREAMENVRRAAIDRLFAFANQASARLTFCAVVRDQEFAAFVRMMLTRDLARRWSTLAPTSVADAHEMTA